MEVHFFPEMLQAGVEALEECRRRELSDEDIAVAVYLAMEGIRAVRAMRGDGLVH